MKRLFHVGAGLGLGILLVLSTTAASGQTVDSHNYVPDPEEQPPKDISKLLEMRRGNRVPNLDQELLKQLIKQMQPNLGSDDLDEKKIAQFLRDHPEFSDPKKLKQLQELAQKLMRSPPPIPNKFDLKNIQETLKKIEEFQRKKTGEPMTPSDPTEPTTSTAKQESPTPDKPPPKKMSKQTEDLAKWLSKNFGDSETMKDLTKDLAEMIAKDGKKTNLLSGLEKEWKSLINSNGGPKFRPPNFSEFTGELSLPDLKSSSSLNVGSNLPNDTGLSPGASGHQSGDSSSLMMFLLLAAIGVIACLYWVRRQQAPEIGAAGERPWPVHPSDIRSRADVVKAFECFSIAKCGTDAVNWHHHQIAHEIASRRPDCSEPAARFAYLYEKARYAPLKDLFSETEIAEARERLRQLAGVPSE